MLLCRHKSFLAAMKKHCQQLAIAIFFKPTKKKKKSLYKDMTSPKIPAEENASPKEL